MTWRNSKKENDNREKQINEDLKNIRDNGLFTGNPTFSRHTTGDGSKQDARDPFKKQWKLNDKEQWTESKPFEFSRWKTKATRVLCSDHQKPRELWIMH